MKTRKPINELTEADLKRFSAWEYDLGEEFELGKDESTVRPLCLDERDSVNRDFWIRTEFRLACGKNLSGLLNLERNEDRIVKIDGDEHSHASKQPFLITRSGQVGFYHGAAEPKSKEITSNYEAMEVDEAEEVFPISYKTESKYGIESITGAIEGFMYLTPTSAALTYKLATKK